MREGQTKTSSFRKYKLANKPTPPPTRENLRFKVAFTFFAALILPFLISLSIAANFSQSYFADMDTQFIKRIAQRFQPSGAFHLTQTRQLLLDQINQSAVNDATALRFVNDLINRVPQVSDISQWAVDDYWATPAEMLASNGGDCEDFVIAKYFALRASGIPSEKMRLTYVKSFQDTKIENHMVLAYYASPEAEPLLLDNIRPQMLPASKRPDLLPVYEFNGEISSKFSGPAMRKWETLLEHMNKEFEL